LIKCVYCKAPQNVNFCFFSKNTWKFKYSGGTKKIPKKRDGLIIAQRFGVGDIIFVFAFGNNVFYVYLFFVGFGEVNPLTPRVPPFVPTKHFYFLRCTWKVAFILIWTWYLWLLCGYRFWDLEKLMRYKNFKFYIFSLFKITDICSIKIAVILKYIFWRSHF